MSNRFKLFLNREIIKQLKPEYMKVFVKVPFNEEIAMIKSGKNVRKWRKIKGFEGLLNCLELCMMSGRRNQACGQ